MKKIANWVKGTIYKKNESHLMFWAIILTSMVTMKDGCTCNPSTTGPLTPVNASQGAVFAETSVAIVPVLSESKRNYIVGFNHYSSSEGGAGAAWSISTDLGKSWTRHLESDPGFSFGVPAELSPADFRGWGADPALVYTGHTGQVAYVCIVGTSTGAGVGIAISTDGGEHFGKAHLVTPPSIHVGADEATVALNQGNNIIWVYWRSQGGKQAWIRGLRYDFVGNLSFITDVTEITGLPFRPGYYGVITAGVIGNRSRIAISLADADDNLPCPAQCVSGVDCFRTIELNYYLIESIDNGQTWHYWKIAHDDAWPNCVTGDNIIGRNRYNRNRTAIAIGPESYYIALTLGSKTGSLVHVYSFDPVHVVGPVDIGSWPPDDRVRHDQFGPSIAVCKKYTSLFPTQAEIELSIGVTWHDTRFDENNLFQLVFGATKIGNNNWNTGIVSGLATWMNIDQTGANWGDYEGLAGEDHTGNFVAAWADNRNKGNSEVWACVLRPF